MWSLMTKGERVLKDSKIGGEKQRWWKDKRQRGREIYDKGRGSIKILSIQVGGKLINLHDAFECAQHLFACMTQVLKFNIHACVVYARCRFEWWNENLACIGYFMKTRPLLLILISWGILVFVYV